MGFISDWAVKRKKLALEILIMAADDLEKVWEDKNRQKRLQSEKEIEIGDREYWDERDSMVKQIRLT